MLSAGARSLEPEGQVRFTLGRISTTYTAAQKWSAGKNYLGELGTLSPPSKSPCILQQTIGKNRQALLVAEKDMPDWLIDQDVAIRMSNSPPGGAHC